MPELSDDYLRVNAPLSDEAFNASMTAIDEAPDDDSGDLPPLSLDLPEVTVTDKPTELVGGGDEPIPTSQAIDGKGNQPFYSPEGVSGTAQEMVNSTAVGINNAAHEINTTLGNITDFLVPDAWQKDPEYFTKEAQKLRPLKSVGDFKDEGIQVPTTVTGDITKGVAQFMYGFVPALKAVKGIKALSATNRVAMTAKTGVGVATAGAAADLAVFDPYEKRLSNMAVESNVPGWAKAIPSFFAADGSDPELLARIKQMGEGYVLGKVLEPFIDLLGAFKKSKKVYAEEQGLVEPTDLTKVAYMIDPATGTKTTVADSIDKPRFTLAEPTIHVPDAATAADFATSYLDGDLEGAAHKASGLINLKHLNTEEGIRDLIEGFAQVRDAAVGKTKRSLKEAGKNASKLGEEAVAEGAARTEGLDAFVINARETRAAIAYKVRDLAHLATANPTPVALAEFEDAFRKLLVVDAMASGIDGEVGRALRAMQRPIAGSGVADKILEMGAGKQTNLEKLAQMTSGLKDGASVVRMAHASTLPNWKDAVTEVYINGLFSPPTAIVNASSNFLSMAGTIGERYLGAYRSQVKGSGELTFREANHYALGLAKGIVDGVAAFSKSWKTNAPVMGHETKFLETGHLAGFQGAAFGITDGSAPMLQKLGKGLDYTGIALRSIPGGTRSLMASDEFFKGMFYKGELAALAQREAHKAGLKKGTPEYLAKVQDILKGAETAKVGDPYHGISMAAQEAAHRNTFTEALGEGGSKLMEGLRHGIIGLASYVVLPFVKTPTNLVKYMWRRTPGLAGQSDYMLGELKAGGARADLAEAQIGTGSMFLTASMFMSAGGYLRGAMTENYRAKANLTQLGIEQQALVNPETGYQIPIGRLDGNPISFLLLGATTQETVAAYLRANGDELTDEELSDGILEIMAVPLAVGVKLASDKSWISGMTQALDAMNNDTKGEYAKKLVGNLVPAGGTLKWLNTQGAIDPYMREAETAMDEMRQKIPGLSRTLPPKPDLLGLPREGTVFNALGMNPSTPSIPEDHPLLNELRELTLNNPDKAILGGIPPSLKVGDSNIKLDDVEKWNLMQFARQLKDSDDKDMIDNMMDAISNPDYKTLTPLARNNHLAKIYKARIKFAKSAIQYDSKMFAEGKPRPYAKEYDLYDYIRKSPLSDTVGTKEYSKAKALFGNVGMSRDDYIEARNAQLVSSNLGDDLK